MSVLSERTRYRAMCGAAKQDQQHSPFTKRCADMCPHLSQEAKLNRNFGKEKEKGQVFLIIGRYKSL